MAVDAPSGILDPKTPWYTAPVNESTWRRLKAQLTGKKQSDGTHYFSEVNLSDEDADRVIENMKKDPRGFPMFDNVNGDIEKYQKWLVETYLGKQPQPEKEPELPDLPKNESSAIVLQPKSEEDLVDEEVDERILDIIGLKDTIDIDYGTYKTLLREKLAESTVGKSSLSRDEEILLQEEFKKVKKKTGRFKPKPKKFDADAFFGRENVRTESPFKPKALLPPSTLEEVKEEPKEEKKNDILDFLKGDFLKELQSIRSLVETISETLKKQYDLEDKEKESSRRESERARGRSREKDLERKEEKAPTLLQKVTKPFTSLFDTIKNFLLNVLLGSAVVWLLDVIKNPQKLLQPIQGVLNGIFGFFNNIIQWIDNTVVDPIRGFIDGVNRTISSFIDQVNNALKLIPGASPIQAPQLPNIPNAPTITAPNITGIPVQRASGGGQIKKVSSKPKSDLRVTEETGYVTKDTGVEITGMGADTQFTALKKGEFVLVPGAAQELGLGFLERLNKRHGGTNNPQVASMGSMKIAGMSGGGLVGGKKPKITQMPGGIGGYSNPKPKTTAMNSSRPNTMGMSNKNMTSGRMPQMSSADYHSLLAISSLEDDDPQGRADVAQSIYNRVLAAQNYNVNFFQRKNTIKEHILAQGQYQPTFSNPMDWKNITDKKTAAVAVMNSEKGKKHKWKMSDAMREIDNTEKALKNPKLQRSSQQLVGGRTFFLAAPNDYQRRPGEVWRGRGSNFFFPSSLEGSQYDRERRNIAAPVPEMLRAKPTPSVPKKRKKKSPTIIPFPVGGNKRSVPGGSTGAKSTPKVSFPSVDPGNITTVITSAILGIIN